MTSVNSNKLTGKKFVVIDYSVYPEALTTLIQIKGRKLNKQFVDFGYKAALDTNTLPSNCFSRLIKEKDFKQLVGRKGYELFYSARKQEFVAVGGKYRQRKWVEIPASTLSKELKNLLAELRNTYAIDGSEIS